MYDTFAAVKILAGGIANWLAVLGAGPAFAPLSSNAQAKSSPACANLC